MFINKTRDGRNNLCGKELADRLQLQGINVDKNAIQQIEAGKRFVIDIELVVIADVLNVSVDTLLYHD